MSTTPSRAPAEPQPPHDAPATAQRRPTRPSGTFLVRFGLLVAWAVVIVSFMLMSDVFMTSGNWASILRSQAVLVVLAFSLIPTLTAGEYDLSVAASLALSAMLVAILTVQQGWSTPLAVVTAIVAAGLVGVVNAVLVVGIGIDSLIATLGTQTFLAGVILKISNGETISGVPSGLVELVNTPKVGQLPLGFFYALGLCILLWYIAQYTPLGRRLLFVGRNRNVSRLSGLHVSRLRAGSFVFGGLMGGLAGVIYVGTSGSADPTSGLTLLLPAMAAVFLGSTAIFPGTFNSWGALIGAYFLATGINGLALLGIGVYVQNLFYGAALVVAVAIAVIAGRRRAKA
ncbi:ABC transporter permease [Terrabacter terrigena]|uniref:ABC transporter permease n=1 Tax=Terrabacter terrigena TaxID=574718 RepID=A0ABW3N0L8_9MICO